MMLTPEMPNTNGHVLTPVLGDDLPARIAGSYTAGATLDELAVEFHMPTSRCRKLLIQAGVELRSSRTPRPARWFDPSAIPLDRQREIADAYRAFPGYEVAAAYGIPLAWVEKIAHLHGVRKAAPRGYRKRRSRSTAQVMTAGSLEYQMYRATLIVEAQVEAASWESAVAQLRQASPAIRVTRVCDIQRLVAAPYRQPG
jgi:hypothetical protein